MKPFVLLFSCLLLIACAKEKAPATNEGAEEILIEKRDDPQVRETILDYRKFLFAKPLRGINSREHFVVQARFVKNDSRIVVHNHFMGFERRDGVELSLQRKDDDLLVEISTPERIAVPLKTLEHVFSHGTEIRLRLEFHDGVLAGTRVLLWIDDVTPESLQRRSLENLTAATADLDTKTTGFYSSASGRGIYGGLELWQIQLRSVRRDLPYVVD